MSAVPSVVATPAARSFIKSPNPHELVNKNGFGNVFGVSAKSDGAIITRKVIGGTPIHLSTDQIADLPTLIETLASTQIGLQSGSKTLLESLIPTDGEGDSSREINPNDTVTNILASAGTDPEIVIPTTSPTAVAVGSLDQPAAPFPSPSSGAPRYGMLAATTGGGGKPRALPTSTNQTARQAIQIFNNHMRGAGVTFEIDSSTGNDALVITSEGTSAIVDGSLSGMFEAGITAVESQLKLTVDRKLITIDPDQSIRITRPAT